MPIDSHIRDSLTGRSAEVTNDGKLLVDAGIPEVQEITGTIYVNNFPSTQSVSAASWPLPTNASTESTLVTRATEATLATRAADATVIARLGVLGQAVMAGSTPIAIASDQSTLVIKTDISSYTHITTAATTTCKSGAGILRRVIVGTVAGAGTISIQDNTTVISILKYQANALPTNFEFNINFATSLKIVTSTAFDVTVIFD